MACKLCRMSAPRRLGRWRTRIRTQFSLSSSPVRAPIARGRSGMPACPAERARLWLWLRTPETPEEGVTMGKRPCSISLQVKIAMAEILSLAWSQTARAIFTARRTSVVAAAPATVPMDAVPFSKSRRTEPIQSFTSSRNQPTARTRRPVLPPMVPATSTVLRQV